MSDSLLYFMRNGYYIARQRGGNENAIASKKYMIDDEYVVTILEKRHNIRSELRLVRPRCFRPINNLLQSLILRRSHIKALKSETQHFLRNYFIMGGNYIICSLHRQPIKDISCMTLPSL